MMLDQLLGRAALKERIADLEEELRHAERRRDAESERRSEAARARQEAQERVNRLEDRIADLEGRLDHQTESDADLTFRSVESLHGDRTREVLDRLASFETGPEGALTAMIEDEVPPAATEAFGDRITLLSRAAPCLAVTDDAGLVSAALTPPITPEAFVTWDERFRLEREWFVPTDVFALALVRSDLFALGEFDGENRTSFTGFTSDVKSTHSKGGFSQGRFERRRDGQIDAHLDKCREAIDACETDRLIVVGERTVLGEFSDVADHTKTVDATGDPEDALEMAFHDFWKTTVYGL